jgi:hypothetical protein
VKNPGDILLLDCDGETWSASRSLATVNAPVFRVLRISLPHAVHLAK